MLIILYYNMKHIEKYCHVRNCAHTLLVYTKRKKM